MIGGKKSATQKIVETIGGRKSEIAGTSHREIALLVMVGYVGIWGIFKKKKISERQRIMERGRRR